MIGITGCHDLGGREEDNDSIDITDHALSYWEKSIHALLVCLSKRVPPLITTDELRRGVENLEDNVYREWSYYERWSAAMATILLERNIITQTELDLELDGTLELEQEPPILFKTGDIVYVKDEDTRCRWRKPHLRVPGYIFGCKGVIQRYIGTFEDPSMLAFRGHGPKQPLYTVLFKQKDIWTIDNDTGSDDDGITIDIYQSWLDVNPSNKVIETVFRGQNEHNHDNDHNHTYTHEHSHSHDHSHDHDHDHKSRSDIELNAVSSEGPPSPGHTIGKCIISILEKRNILIAGEIHKTISILEQMSTSFLGAKLVARAWVDPKFKELLLTNASAAGAGMGITTTNPNAPTVLIVVENTDKVHNLCVCTLCSCYPSSILGLSPSWYKSRSYRSRAVKEPRAVLREFGTILNNDVAIIVHDSTADTRYMVLPERPKCTENFTEEELVRLVTRDSLIGVTRDIII